MSRAETINILAVAGARPNFMKIAPLLREIEGREGVGAYLVHTGQHYDKAMSEQFFNDLGIAKPDANLGVGSGSHAQQTADVLRKIEPILIEQKPDALLVVGDVNSTVAATLAAIKLQIPVAHVEAGLRSNDRSMPEELNRLMTDVVARWLFVTEPSGQENLLREGIPQEKIHFTGNVMIDTLRANLDRAKELDTLDRLGLEPQAYAVLTLHRPSNVDDPSKLSALFSVLEEIHAEIPILFPIHPRTRASIESLLGGKAPGLQLVDPLGYLDFLRLMSDSKFVLTDSGGIQEETTALVVPCITLRENTERPITVTQGSNVIVGSDPERIRFETRKILAGQGKRGQVPDLWDGLAASRIIDILEKDLRGRAK